MALATNGTLITTETAREVVKAGFRRVSISLDGPDAETHDQFRQVPGAFDKAVDGFIRLKELGVSMQVNTTVTRHNRSRLGEIHELVRKLGADAWHLFLLVPVGCGLELAPGVQLSPSEYEAVLGWVLDIAESGGMDVRAICAPHVERIRLERGPRENLETASPPASARRGCLAGIAMCFISHRGEVFPCGYLPVKAGDVRQQPFAAIWERAPIFAELRDFDRLRGKCGVCEYRTVCGGCRARALGETGDYLAEETRCSYHPPGLLMPDPAQAVL
jgi:radical SAM protein with 4Fe4S-binding SPASM domain